MTLVTIIGILIEQGYTELAISFGDQSGKRGLA
jgi:hypothetical protein